MSQDIAAEAIVPTPRSPGVNRSASPDVRNPLLKLPSALALSLLPDAERRALRALLDEIRREARAKANGLWARRRVRAAAYWRACSVYAGHAARLAHSRPATSTTAPSVAPANYDGPNPVLGLAASRAMRDLPGTTRAAVRSLLQELRRDAAASSTAAWAKSKSPMAAYWADVSTFAGDAARTLRDARTGPPAFQAAITNPWGHCRLYAGAPQHTLPAELEAFH